MGYRSNGCIWLPDNTYEKLSKDLKQDLEENWDKHEDHTKVWTFSDWKWYEGYDDVDKWQRFYYAHEEHDDIDLLVVGEDSAVVFQGNFTKFSYITLIDILD